jgi:rubrerythrin
VTKKVPVQKRSKAEYKRLRKMQEEARVGKPLKKSSKLTPQQVRKAIKDAYKITKELTAAYTKAHDKASREVQRKVRQIQKQCPHENIIDTKLATAGRPIKHVYRCKDCGAEVLK